MLVGVASWTSPSPGGRDLVEVLIESEGAADNAADNFDISVSLEPGTCYLRVQRVAADDGKPFTVRAWNLAVQ